MEIFYDPNLYKILILVFIFSAVAGFIFYMLNDIDLTLKRRKYEATLKQAIALDRLQSDDVYLLATRWFVKKDQIATTLNFILSDYINDKDCSDEKLERIRELIICHQENDPFSDLPDDIKLQLQQIQKMAGDGHQDILRLSKSLSEIYLSNQRKAKNSWILSLCSFLIGIVGLLYGFSK
ncbi:Uncharacterised protein [Serratia fonticola]|uniref:hypothetical protein n=1 Tax=Serratia fonticola TaxID=47917 RepID=UPI0015755982|nr:hypothetical protein [Serratia fonticola]NTY88882.1 hypothetical protein [Serratia fonticola]NTZ14527.1 hypothetical protein [Serratia fonticola]CAI1967086.1 Uncharacterised protein [Serratia fonticola]CAI2505293.1 Uncharacterised protein [Serratia fonticola]